MSYKWTTITRENKCNTNKKHIVKHGSPHLTKMPFLPKAKSLNLKLALSALSLRKRKINECGRDVTLNQDHVFNIIGRTEELEME